MVYNTRNCLPLSVEKELTSIAGNCVFLAMSNLQIVLLQ